MKLSRFLKKSDVSKIIVKKQNEVGKSFLERLGLDGGGADNPYIRGREAWDDLYGSAINDKYNAYRIIAILALCLGIAMIGLVKVAHESKVVPYVVEMKEGNVMSSTIAQASEMSPQFMKGVIKATLQGFIINVRSVSADLYVDKMQINNAFAHTTGQAQNVLIKYIDDNLPFQEAKNFQIRVNVNYVMEQSPSTYQIEWTEIKEDLSGNVLGQQKYVAQLSYQIVGDNNPSSSQMKYNPMGIYITNIAWSRAN